MYWGVDVYVHAFLISAVDGGEWAASTLSQFTLEGEGAPCTCSIGGWRGLQY